MNCKSKMNAVVGACLLASALGAQAADQSISVNVHAYVQGEDFAINAVRGSVWAAAAGSTSLAATQTVNMSTDASKKVLMLEQGQGGNKAIQVKAAKGKKLSAAVEGAELINVEDNTVMPLTVTMDGKNLTDKATLIIDGAEKEAVKNVALDITGKSEKALAAGNYQGNLTLVLSAG